MTTRRALVSLGLSSLALFACGAPAHPPIASETPAVAPDPEALWSQARSDIEAGEVERGIERLRATLARWPGLAPVRGRLADVLVWDGDPDGAVAVLQEGLELTSEAPDRRDLAIQLGRLFFDQAEDGPNITHRRGTVTAQPSDRDVDEATFRSERLARAARAFEVALRAVPGDADATAWLASIREELGDDRSALALWEGMIARREADALPHVRAARVLMRLHEVDRAERHSRRAAELAPHVAPVWTTLADVLEERGDTEGAARARDRASFEAFLPSFATVPHTPENERIVRTLAAYFEERTEPSTEDVDEIIAQLRVRDDTDSARLLAAFVWHHSHDARETAAHQALEARGASVAPVLIALVREARSVCTIREASGALARLRHPEAFDVLVELLPRDVQFAHPMLAARWLAVLGDERAVPHLVRAMQRRGDDSDPIVDAGIHFARGQAALALGRFDTDVAARALERALTDEAIAEYAHAALYRLTNDDGHIAALESLDPEALVFLASYLDEIGRPRARALAERIRAAEERADGAGDDGDDGGE